MGILDFSFNANQQPNRGLGLNTSLLNNGQMFSSPLLDYTFGQQGTMPELNMGGAQGLQMNRNVGGYGGMNNWGQQNNMGGHQGFDMNMPSFALGLQGLNSLGSLYMGAKSLSLANKQFESAEKFSNANLANQTHLTNDALQTRINRIGSGNGTSAADMAAEYERRKLPTRV